MEITTVDLWIAEAENGSIIFDTCPSDSDVAQVCEDLTGEVKLYAVIAMVTQAKLVSTYQNPDEEDA